MIYLLQFEKYFEANHYHTDAHSSLLSIYDIFRRRNIPCMLIYRYKLPNLSDWVNPKDIQTKFGFNNPDKFDINKINTKHIILYHVECFEKDINKFREFLSYCKEQEINIYIPIKKDFERTLKPLFWIPVATEVLRSNYQSHTINSLQDEFRFQRIVERGLNLDDLLG